MCKQKTPLSWQFYRKFGPLGACIFVATTSYGGIFLLRWLVEKHLYLSKFRTFFPGDIFLSMYAYCMGVLVKENNFEESWEDNTVVQFLIVISGFAYPINGHIVALLGATPEFTMRSSQWYHNFLAFGVIFYLIIAMVPFLLRSKGPIWARICASICLIGYSGCIIYDAFLNRQTDPFAY